MGLVIYFYVPKESPPYYAQTNDLFSKIILKNGLH